MDRKTIITVLTLLCCCMAAMAATPAQMLERCAAKLRGASGIYARFTMKGAGGSSSGTLRSKGSKFALTSAAGSTWYDGTDMWVYSPASGDATVWHPSRSELAEANPLLYLSTTGNYTVSKDPKSAKGTTTLILTPKRRTSGVKSVRLTIADATMLPRSIAVSTGSGTITVTLSDLRLNAPADASAFRFPRSKYPKARISDLR